MQIKFKSLSLISAIGVAGFLHTENRFVAFISNPLNWCLQLIFSYWSNSSSAHHIAMLAVTRHQQDDDSFKMKVHFQEIQAGV